MIRIALCDDDTKFTGELETLVINESQQLGIRTEIDVFSDGVSLLSSIQKGEQYSLIFIDIEMEYMNGITAARHIRKIDRSVLLIYISNYDKYLKELFEVETFRFLSKPLNKEQFKLYFNDACKRISEITNDFYSFTFNKAIRKVSIKDIVYIESQNRIINIYLNDNSYEYFYGKLDDVEKELTNSSYYFFRIHQSFIVNYSYIKRINFSSVIITFMEKEIELKISERRQKKVCKQLCEINSKYSSMKKINRKP